MQYRSSSGEEGHENDGVLIRNLAVKGACPLIDENDDIRLGKEGGTNSLNVTGCSKRTVSISSARQDQTGSRKT